MKSSFQFGKMALNSLIFCALLTVCRLVAQTASFRRHRTRAPDQDLHLPFASQAFRNAKGRVSIALYRDAKGFPSDTCKRCRLAEI